jgi:hypothetical protein
MSTLADDFLNDLLDVNEEEQEKLERDRKKDKELFGKKNVVVVKPKLKSENEMEDDATNEDEDMVGMEDLEEDDEADASDEEALPNTLEEIVKVFGSERLDSLIKV